MREVAPDLTSPLLTAVSLLLSQSWSFPLLGDSCCANTQIGPRKQFQGLSGEETRKMPANHFNFLYKIHPCVISSECFEQETGRESAELKSTKIWLLESHHVQNRENEAIAIIMRREGPREPQEDRDMRHHPRRQIRRHYPQIR